MTFLRYFFSAFCILSLVSIASCGGGSSSGTGLTSNGEAVDQRDGWLFVVQGKQATSTDTGYGRDRLTIPMEQGEVIGFTDRPARQTARITPSDFVNEWESFGFANVPPNASVTGIDQAGNQVDVVVELFRPVWDAQSNTLSFETRPAPNSDQIPNVIHDLSLFIDDATVPPGPVDQIVFIFNFNLPQNAVETINARVTSDTPGWNKPVLISEGQNQTDDVFTFNAVSPLALSMTPNGTVSFTVPDFHIEFTGQGPEVVNANDPTRLSSRASLNTAIGGMYLAQQEIDVAGNNISADLSDASNLIGLAYANQPPFLGSNQVIVIDGEKELYDTANVKVFAKNVPAGGTDNGTTYAVHTLVFTVYFSYQPIS